MFTGGKTAGEKGRCRNPHEAAGQPGVLEKPVHPAKRQNGTVADEGVYRQEELSSGEPRAVCGELLKKEIDGHDGAAVIPREGAKFCRCCKGMAQGNLRREREKAIVCIQFSGRFYSHEFYYRADRGKMRYNVADSGT